MTTISTPYGALRVDGFASPLNWRISTDMPGLVVNDQRVTLSAVLDLRDKVSYELNTYAYQAQRNGATGIKGATVTDGPVRQVVIGLLDHIVHSLRALLNPQPRSVTEIVVDGLADARTEARVAELLTKEFSQLFDTQTVEYQTGRVVVTGSAYDESRVIEALLNACVPASVHSRTAVRITMAELPHDIDLTDDESDEHEPT